MPSRRDVSFLTTLRSTPGLSLLWPEGITAIALGIGGGFVLTKTLEVEQRLAVVGDVLGVLGVLVGVVFAGFALVAALFSDDYLRLLNKAEGGVVSFLRPFMLAIGSQVAALLVSITYRATALDLTMRVEKGLFLGWGFLFAFALLDVVALTRNVMLHVLTRTDDVTGGQAARAGVEGDDGSLLKSPTRGA